MDDFVPRSHSSEELAARQVMITLIRRSYRQGLFTATHGTYSVRLSDISDQEVEDLKVAFNLVD